MSPAFDTTSPRGDDQVTELQADNSRLCNESRMWRRRYDATRKCLDFVMVEAPIMVKLAEGAEQPADDNEVAMFLAGIRAMHARLDQLEKDAWTSINGHVRKFLESVRDSDLKNKDVHGLYEFIRSWEGIFKDALG